MADDSGDDSWLYGDSNPEPPDNTETNDSKPESNNDNSTELTIDASVDEPSKDLEPTNTENADHSRKKTSDEEASDILDDTSKPTRDDGEAAEADGEAADQEEEAVNGNGTEKEVTQAGEDAEEDDDDDDDDDSDDDDVQVTIGDIKTSPTYTAISLKRGLGQDKNKQPGKFSIEEFEAVGTINGQAAHELNLDSLEDKPWRKPGADITDYFNYGFNEDTWRAYCERQKRIRVHDSGVGLASLGGTAKIPGSISVAIVNDNSKYSGNMGPKKAGPPPGRKYAGSIDVIGGTSASSRRSLENQKAAGTSSTPPEEPQESPIQVMTADRREYGRSKAAFPDLTVPPPMPPFDMPPPGIDPIQSFTGSGSYSSDFYTAEADPYYHNYEPTADLQWGTQPWDNPTTVSGPPPPLLPPGPTSSNIIPLGQDGTRKSRSSPAPGNVEIKEEPGLEKERSERHGRHRHRSRSRSAEKSSRSSGSSKKRNKSRSRSPHRHRSKKKSRRERDESE